MNEIDVVDPLSLSEIEQEAALIEQIRQGMEFANKSYFMIIEGLRKVKDFRLYREVGTLRDWALMHFGFGDREYNYYLKAGEVVENIRSVDPEANPKLTHALAIGMVELGDQQALWKRVKESGKTLTKKLIVNTAKEMEAHGEIKAREGVNIKAEGEGSYLIYRIKVSWASIEEDLKPDLISDILALEPEVFLRLVIQVAQEELEKRNEKY
jgi:hypothetical protein